MVVVGLREFAPVGRRATSWRDWRGPERFAKVCQGLTSRGRSHPGLLPLTNLRFEVSRFLPAAYSVEDIAATRRALERKLFPHPRHELGPGNPERVVRAGLLMFVTGVTAASRAVPATRVPVRFGLLPLADVAFCHAT